MILSGIWAECGRLLSDVGNARWVQSVLTTRANLAQAEIQGYTNAVKTQEPLTPVASQRTLGLNANTMDVLNVTKTYQDGTIRPFIGISRQQLDFMYPDWQQQPDGEPLYWFYDATAQNLNLVPKPSALFAITNGITVWESRKPADLASASDVPFDANNQMIPYHMAIVYWVVAQCFMDDGTAEALTKSKFYKSGAILRPGQYEDELGRIMAEFDDPEDVPANIVWRPTGGRLGNNGYPTKSYPLNF